MQTHKRIAAVVAKEGFTGLVRRAAGKVVRSLTGQEHPDVIWHAAQLLRDQAERDRANALADAEEAMTDAARARDAAEAERQRAAYAAQVSTFADETRRRGAAGAASYYWYHTIDLGGGLVTPGDYDYRPHLPEYPFPADMRGMSALDVGSGSGFFAFEFEKRGAEVVSVDLPSLSNWDMIWSDRESVLDDMRNFHGAATFAELDHFHMHGPFGFCHRQLGSRVRRCLSRVYDLTPQKLGRDGFDLVFLGDVLGHLFSPLEALNVLGPLCRGQMVITQNLPVIGGATIGYGGGERPEGDCRFWFSPNWECLRQMLRRVGFRDVRHVGRSRVFIRRAWAWMGRDVIVATK